MAEQPVSPSWYRVAGLRPRLRSHFRMHRHEYRGRRWHVLEDRLSRRTHRFEPHTYYVVGLMDGRRTVQRIWEVAVERAGESAPTQEEVIQLLGQLHAADAIQCEVTPDVAELLRRSQRIRRRGALARWAAPLAIRIPLIDPDRFLERTLPLYRWMFGSLGAALWLAVLAWGVVAGVQHWDELSRNLDGRLLAFDNLVVLLLVFPVLKALHEFGHACAVKAWGGEVHEMGIMLLVLMPVPYVDASSATAFPEKRRRLVVGAAGMMVELFIAAVALALWLDMQGGTARAVLYNVMVIAGVSTVLFNANPLLRFDGYYILTDLIEIPNLRQRANQYLGALVERRLFALNTPPSETGMRERAWFVFFAVASFCYRLFITLAIALFIATQYFVFGVLLALWAVVTGILVPIVMLFGYLAMSPRLRRYRVRAIATSGALAAVLGGLLFMLPVPSWTYAQGVVWGVEQSAVRGRADGFVLRVVAQPGARVRPGELLLEAHDPMLPPLIRSVEAQREEIEARWLAQRSEDLVRAQMSLEKLKALDAELARLHEQRADLLVRSPSAGVFALPSPDDLPGRFVRQGEPVAFVVPEGAVTARVLVAQEAAELVRGHTTSVSVKLAERLGETHPARIIREVPLASAELPSLALSQAGGGEIALDPGNGQPKAAQTHFQFELEVLGPAPVGAGGRVHVRFDHPAQTVAAQLWRLVRQLFLKRFAV